MRYRFLPLKTYQDFAKNIRSLYKAQSAGSEYHEHTGFMKLFELAAKNLDGASEREAINTYVGLAAFVLEQIAYAYWRTPEHRDKLYDLIVQHFNIQPANLLRNDERIIYINHYYEFVSSCANTGKAQQDGVHYDELAKRIDAGLVRIIKRDQKRLDDIKKAIPRLEGIQNIVEECFTEYEKKNKERWFPSDKRKPLLRFIDFVNFSCKRFYPSLDTTDHSEKSRFLSQLRDDEYKIYEGITIFALVSIYREYKWACNAKGNLFSNGSNLYQIFMDRFNTDSLHSFSDDLIVETMTSLTEYLAKNFLNNPAYFRAEFDEWKLDRGALVDKEVSFTQFEREMREFFNKAREFRQIPSIQTWKSWAATKTVSQLAKLSVVGGTGYLTAHVAGRASVMAIAGTATNLAGPIGMTVSAGLFLLWMLINQLITDKLMTTTQALVFGWIFDRIDSSVDNTASSLVNYMLTKTKESLEDIISKLSDDDKILLQDWINTLLSLRDSVVSETEKTEIRNVFGIKPGAKWEYKALSVQPLAIAPAVLMHEKSRPLAAMVMDDYDSSHHRKHTH